MKPTDIAIPDYFHKVVDCQWACPAHTDVPEYIRLIAQGRFTDAYMVNRHSNVFPGILGRVCDRPCEPACRRGRVGSAAVTSGIPLPADAAGKEVPVIRVVGAMRATASCAKCHEVPVGTLLGAFSYTLFPASSALGATPFAVPTALPIKR